ncbi:MAG TPA: glycosyltransferase family 39 protein, partial [Anaerolineae bacterium]
MTSSTRRHESTRFALPLILLAFVLIALVYSVSIPLGEAPDEVSHWSYVQYLTTHLRLPGGDGASAGEAHQPPLYYLLGAFVSFSVPEQQFDVYANPDWYLGNTDTPNLLLHTRREAFPYRGGVLAWHLVRLFSILLGAITVWATYRLARLVFPDSAWVAPTAAAFVAFIPQFTFLSAVVNNDNLVIALSALALLAFLRTGRDVRACAFIITGVLLGLAVLAKVSAFSLWVALALAMVVNGQGTPIRERAANLLVTFATASAVVSPWLVYSGIALGDPLGFTRMAEGFARPSPMTGADWIIYGERMFVSFWGKFGGVTNVGMPDAVY